MLHDPEAREVRDALRDFARSLGLPSKLIEDRSSRRIRERLPDRIEIVVHRPEPPATGSLREIPTVSALHVALDGIQHLLPNPSHPILHVFPVFLGDGTEHLV